MSLVIYGIVCWLATLILVESELFRPLREWVDYHRQWSAIDRIYNRRRPPWHKAWVYPFWSKLGYLVGCHLCAGTWVGLVIAAVTGYRVDGQYGFVGFVLAGLAIKAVGHLTLEVAALLARLAPKEEA